MPSSLVSSDPVIPDDAKIKPRTSYIELEDDLGKPVVDPEVECSLGSSLSRARSQSQASLYSAPVTIYLSTSAKAAAESAKVKRGYPIDQSESSSNKENVPPDPDLRPLQHPSCRPRSPYPLLSPLPRQHHPRIAKFMDDGSQSPIYPRSSPPSLPNSSRFRERRKIPHPPRTQSHRVNSSGSPLPMGPKESLSLLSDTQVSRHASSPVESSAKFRRVPRPSGRYRSSRKGFGDSQLSPGYYGHRTTDENFREQESRPRTRHKHRRRHGPSQAGPHTQLRDDSDIPSSPPGSDRYCDWPPLRRRVWRYGLAYEDREQPIQYDQSVDMVEDEETYQAVNEADIDQDQFEQEPMPTQVEVMDNDTPGSAVNSMDVRSSGITTPSHRRSPKYYDGSEQFADTAAWYQSPPLAVARNPHQPHTPYYQAHHQRAPRDLNTEIAIARLSPNITFRKTYHSHTRRYRLQGNLESQNRPRYFDRQINSPFGSEDNEREGRSGELGNAEKKQDLATELSMAGLSPNVTPYRKEYDFKNQESVSRSERKRCPSYYDEDIIPQPDSEEYRREEGSAETENLEEKREALENFIAESKVTIKADGTIVDPDDICSVSSNSCESKCLEGGDSDCAVISADTHESDPAYNVDKKQIEALCTEEERENRTEVKGLPSKPDAQEEINSRRNMESGTDNREQSAADNNEGSESTIHEDHEEKKIPGLEAREGQA